MAYSTLPLPQSSPISNWINPYRPYADTILDPNSPLNASGATRYADQSIFNDPNAPDMQTLIKNTLAPDGTPGGASNLFTKGWIDSQGTWHPYGNLLNQTRVLGSVNNWNPTQAMQSYGGGPPVPVNASDGNNKYSPFSTSYGPASQTGTQSYDQYGNPISSEKSTTPTNMTFGGRYLQGTNYIGGNVNPVNGLPGFWQTLEQNQAGWTPSPTAQDLMAKNIPQPSGNNFDFTQTPIASKTISNLTPISSSYVPSATPGTNVSPLSSAYSVSPASNNPLFKNKSQGYMGSPAWSAMRGLQ